VRSVLYDDYKNGGSNIFFSKAVREQRTRRKNGAITKIFCARAGGRALFFLAPHPVQRTEVQSNSSNKT